MAAFGDSAAAVHALVGGGAQPRSFEEKLEVVPASRAS